MTYRVIKTDANGANTYEDLPSSAFVPISRLYCGYSDNTSETTAAVGVWERFPYSATGIQSYRSIDFTVDPTMTRFIYTGLLTKWFKINATCNILKGTGESSSRDLEVSWRKNGVQAGPARRTHLIDANVISGEGQLPLSTGDYIEPFIRNIQNDDKVVMYNCSFDIRDDPDKYWSS